MGRPRKPRPQLTFICDTREQFAFRFGPLVRREFAGGATVVQKLDEGDYAVKLNDEILSARLERKSLSDFFGVCGHGRDRFQAELERLRAYDYRALIIEATADDILRGFERSQISGRAAMASLLCWSVKYHVHPILAENHRRGAAIAQRILEEIAVHHLERLNGQGADEQPTSPGGDQLC